MNVRPLIDRVDGERAVIIAVHGFTRSPEHLEAFARSCMTQTCSVVRPRLGSLNYATSMNRATVVSSLATEMALIVEEFNVPVVVVGHSAGAAAGSWLAAELLDAGVDVQGLVSVEGVESPTHLIERSWPRIERLPSFAVAAPPSRCNRGGALVQWLRERRSGEFGAVVAGSGHGDIEGQEHPVYRWACGDRSTPQIRATVRDLVIAQVLGQLGLPARGRDLDWVDRSQWAERSIVGQLGSGETMRS